MAKGKVNGSGQDDDFDISTKYSPADFIYPAQDHQGHSERVWCRLQPMYDRQIDVILRSKKFPFKTKGDVIRCGIVHLLKKLDTLEPMPGFLGRAESINSMLRDELMFMEFMEMFGTLEKVVGQHLSGGSKQEAQRLIAKTKATIMKIEEPYWQKKCLEELKKRFGHSLSGVEMVKLSKNEEGDNERTDGEQG